MTAEATQEAQFEPTPAGWARRWKMELDAARKALQPWHTQGTDIDKRFKDERSGSAVDMKRLNLFTSNVQTQRAMLFGQTPKVSVSRRFADARDDVARVASEMLERLLNTDIERADDGYATALQHALDDRLLPGLGNVRVRYVVETEAEEVPPRADEAGNVLAPGYTNERKTREDVETDYVHWRDQLWSPAKVFGDLRWWAFRAEMGREALVERFGEEVGKAVPLNAKRDDSADAKQDDPWSRAEVWEVWSKEHRRVFWFVDGYPVVLDEKEDPLGLAGFWPFPKPMAANLTTSSIIPRPDYVLAQDLYEEIDTLTTRIDLLTKAVRVVGAYDKAHQGALSQMLRPDAGNAMIPVDAWAALAEKGGIRGVVDWMPLEQVVAAISVLREQRRNAMDDLFQVTGMSDIMRGQAAGAATATEQSIKAKFGSVRIQAMQDEFARFASDVQRLKAEIIAKHFDATTILERCNCANTPDAQLAPQAVDLIKSRFGEYRVEVKPEAVSLQDFAALKAERMEVLMGLSSFLQAAAPLAQAVPGSMPFLLQMLQWAMSGLRGASAIEGVLDQAIAAAQQAAATPAGPQQPDPKLLAQQMKGQQDMAKVQAELQADLIRTNAEVQADAQREQNQALWNTREANAKAQISAANRATQVKPGGGL